jgi:hypothetical protein
VEEGPPGIVPRLPNSGSGRAAGRELDFPRPPDLGGSDRGRAKSGHGALKGFLILCSVPRSTRSGSDLFVWGRRRLEAARVHLNLEQSERPLPVGSLKTARIRPAGAWLTGLGYDRKMDNRTKLDGDITTPEQHQTFKEMLLRLLDDPQIQQKIGAFLRGSGLYRSTGINVPQRWYR